MVKIMKNTNNIDFLVTNPYDSPITDCYVDKSDWKEDVIEEPYTDELFKAYEKLEEMSTNNYNELIEDDYDELCSLNLYKVRKKYDKDIFFKNLR